MQQTARNNATQIIAYTGTAAAVTNPFGTQTRQIRIVSNSACHYTISSGAPVSTVLEAFLPANWVEYLNVNAGEKISVIQAATGGLITGTAGTLWVTELS